MASPFETLFMIFEADASKVDDGLKDATKAADKLENKLEDVDKKAGMLGSSFLEMVKGFAAGAVAGLLTSSLASLVTETVSMTMASKDAADALGVSVAELEALDSAAQVSGGQTGAFTASLGNLSRMLNEVAKTGKGAAVPMFEQLGLSVAELKAVSDDPIEALGLLADKFEHLSKTEAAQLGQKLGLDPGTINLMRQGRIGIADLVAQQKALYTLTEQDAEAAEKFEDQLDKLVRMVNAVKRAFVTTLLPALTWVLEKIESVVGFMKDNQTAVIAFFTVVAGIVLAVFLPAILSAVAAVWALIAPFLAVGLAIAAVAAIVALVFDDINSYLNGQDSMIGELAKKWPIIGVAVKELGLVFEWLKELLSAGFAFIVDLIESGPTAAFQNLKERVFGVLDSIAARFPPFAWTINVVKMAVNGATDAFGFLWENIKTGASLAMEFLKRLWDVMGPVVKGAAKLMGIDLSNVSFNVQRGVAKTEGWQSDAMGVMERNRAKREARDAGGGVISQDAAARPKGTNTTPKSSFAGFDLGAAQLSAIDMAAAGSGVSKAAAANPFGQGGGNGGAAAMSAAPAAQTKTITVTVDRVEVSTQATDADGIASSMAGALTQEINAAINAADNGMRA